MSPAETMSAADAPPTFEERRSRRKSARAAAAYLAATLKEELVPEEDSESEDEEERPPASRPVKRSHSRGSAKKDEEDDDSEAYVPTSAPPSPRPSSAHSRAAAAAARNHAKKKAALSPFAVEYLKAWMMSPDHIEHPYPTEDEKVRIMRETGIELKQLTNWFVNNRKRYWKPKVEELRRKAAGCNATLQEMAAKEQAANGGGPRPRSDSMLVSSEEESEVESAAKTPKSANKKRKKYSTLHAGKAKGRGTPSRGVKKARGGGKQLVGVVEAPGIHVAATHEGMKLARKMSHDSTSKKGPKKGSLEGSRVVSESSETDMSSDEDVRSPILKPMVVCNPLEAAVDDLVNDPIVEDDDTLKPPAIVAAPAVPVPEQTQEPDYSISPFDNVVTINTREVTKTVDATPVANTVGISNFCCGAMPHSCDAADPKSNIVPPCALCSACRDWNMGEFCPWDLTGIIGDIVADDHGTAVAQGAIAPPPALARSTSTGSTHATFAESVQGAATTVTKGSLAAEEAAADAASIEGDAEVGDDTWNPSSTKLGSIPKEIIHSASSADFMSSIETWD